MAPFGITLELLYVYDGPCANLNDFMRIMKQIGITLGHFEITLGLLWVYEDHFGSLRDHFGMT